MGSGPRRPGADGTRPVFGVKNSDSFKLHHRVVSAGRGAGSDHVQLMRNGSFHFPFCVSRGRLNGG